MRPQVIISQEGEKWLKQGQMWMYRNNLVRADACENGAEVDIVGETGTYLGTGFMSQESHVVVRIMTKQRDTQLDRAFFTRRLKSAYDYRKTIMPENLTNCRLVFGEADFLPGLTIDRYNEILVTQITSYGLEMRKDMLYDCIMDILRGDHQDVRVIYERNDVKARAKEGLPLEKGVYIGTLTDTHTTISENGLKLIVDIENGQKTGYFLDQKSNRMLIRGMAHDKRVLDCFTHTGGFALNAALGHARHVDAVDVSKTALEQAYANAKLNHLEGIMRFIQADVFDYLDECAPGQYDLIILDPPAFTKSRRTVKAAYNGYKRINMQAMKLLRGGGYLATCSCSRFMETELFEEMLLEAAQTCGVELKQISVSQQNGDHPILWHMQKTSYLKFYIFQII